MLAHCETPLRLIETFNPDFCQNRYKDFNTVELALKSGMFKLSELKFAYSEDTAIDLISAWLFNFSIYLGLSVDRNLILDISRGVYSEIFMLNIAELTFFFSRLKKGYFGAMYGRFDGMMICTAAREYRKQRGMILSKLPENEQKELI